MTEHIISDNQIQGNLALQPDQIGTQADQLQQMLASVPVSVQKALELSRQGFNVMPLPYGQKTPQGYSWGRWSFTPVTVDITDTRHPAFLEYHDAFAGRVNYAIICGRTSGNLIVLDCDNRLLFDQYCDTLTARDIPIYAVMSHKGGHIYLRTDQRVTSVKGTVPDLDIKFNGYVLGVGSLHPKGTIYTLYEGNTADQVPVISVDQLDFLTDATGQPVTLRTGKKRQLNKATRDYLDTGHTIAPGNRNNALYKSASNFRVQGYTQADAHYRLSPVARASGLDQAEIDQTIQSAYNSSSSDTRQTARHHKAQAAADAHNWSYRTGVTDRAIFDALISRAERDSLGTGTFTASERQLSELSGLSGRTVRVSIARLIDQAIIERDGIDRVSGARKYRFTDTWVQQGVSKVRTSNTGNAKHLVRTNDTLPDYMQNSPLWHRGYFGTSAKRVYRALRASHVPLTAVQLQRATGLSESAVKRVMRLSADARALRHHNLIEHVPQGYIAHDIDRAGWHRLEYTVTNTRGQSAHGKRDRLRQRHRLERQIRLLRDIIRHRRRYDTNAPYYGLSDHTRTAQGATPADQAQNADRSGTPAPYTDGATDQGTGSSATGLPIRSGRHWYHTGQGVDSGTTARAVTSAATGSDGIALGEYRE